MPQGISQGLPQGGYGSFDTSDNMISTLHMAMLQEVYGVGPGFHTEGFPTEWAPEPKTAPHQPVRTPQPQPGPRRLPTPPPVAVPALSLSPLTTPEPSALSTLDGALDDSPLSHRCCWKTDDCVCGHVCASEKELQDHCFLEHVPERKPTDGFRCCWQGCERPKPFQQKSKLERHMMTHTCYKPFECTHPGCAIRLSSQQALVQHERTHTGEMPYKCEWPGCTQKFKSKSAYTNHTRTHTGEKPLVCDVCLQRFSESSNLAKHRKTHHQSEGKHRCGKCGATFERKCALVGHSLRCDGSHGPTTAASRRHRKAQTRHARCESSLSHHAGDSCIGCIDEVVCGDEAVCGDEVVCDEACVDAHCEAACSADQCTEAPCTQTECTETDCNQECLDDVCVQEECEATACPSPGMAQSSFHGVCPESGHMTMARHNHAVCHWPVHGDNNGCGGMAAQHTGACSHEGCEGFDSMALAELLTRLDEPLHAGHLFDGMHDGQFDHFDGNLGGECGMSGFHHHWGPF